MTAPSRSNDARRAYMRARAYGRWDALVSADPARAHVRELMAGGMTQHAVQRASGVSYTTIDRLLRGVPGRRKPTIRLRKESAAAILAVTAPPARAKLDACGTMRRLQALSRVGWPMKVLSARAGKHQTWAVDLASGRWPRVSVETRDAVAALYDALWDQDYEPPPGRAYRAGKTRAIRHAERMAWPPPMAWDDDDIDRPAARPYGRWRAAS